MMTQDIYQVEKPLDGAHNSQLWADLQANPSVAYPAVYSIGLTPNSFETTHRIRRAWLDYTYDINRMMGTLEGFELALQNWSGWINVADNPEYGAGAFIPYDRNDPNVPAILPKVAGVITVGNYVNKIGSKNRSVQIEIFDWQAEPPNISEVNPTTHPWLFDIFQSINASGKIGYAPQGRKFWFPRLAKGGIGWLPAEILQKAELPQKETTLLNSQRAHGLDFKGGYAVRYKPDPAQDPILLPDYIVQQITQGLAVDDYSAQFKKDSPVYKAIAAEFPNQTAAEILYRDIKRSGVKIHGAYHYVRTEANPADQTDLYLATWDELGGFDFTWWDYELLRNILTKKTDDDFFKQANRVKLATGKKLMWYMNIAELIAMVERGSTWILEEDLAIARYMSPSRMASDLVNPADFPHAFWDDTAASRKAVIAAKNYKMWQFAGGSTYIDPVTKKFVWGDLGYKVGRSWGVQQDNVDRSWFDGTVADLYVYLGKSPVSVPDPDPTPEPTPMPSNALEILWADYQTRKGLQ